MAFFELDSIGNAFYLSIQIIYMYRNPRDVCQSAFNHFKTLHDDFSGTLQDVVTLMTNDVGNAFGPYFKHILGYWNRRLDENLLVISFI